MNKRIVKIINEEISYLVENKESKNRSKARNYLRSVGYDDNSIAKIEKGLINDLSPYIRESEFKFMLGSARFFYERKITSGDDIKKLKELIKLINIAHLNEYDNNFNNEDFNSLYNRFETRIEQDFEEDQYFNVDGM